MGNNHPGVYKRKQKDGRVVWDAVVRVAGNQKWKRGFASADEAAGWRMQLKKDVYEGKLVDLRDIQLQDWLADYIKRGSWRVRVRKNYIAYLRNHVADSIGHIPLSKLTWKHLTTFYESLDLSSKSVRNVHAFISGGLKDAVRKGLITHNPAQLADLPRLIQKERPIWTAEELHYFMESAKDDDYWYVAYRLAAFPGLRRGEVIGLQWPDINFEKGHLSVKRAVSPGVIDKPKTQASVRKVPLDDTTLSLLRERLNNQLASDHYTEWVFPAQKKDGPVYPARMNFAFREACERAGVTVIPIHSLRHTWATLALEDGVHEVVIQKVLGHTKGSTSQIYQHAQMPMMEEAVKKVADAAKRLDPVLTPVLTPDPE